MYHEFLTEHNLKPWEVDQMDCTMVDAFLVIGKKKKAVMQREIDKNKVK